MRRTGAEGATPVTLGSHLRLTPALLWNPPFFHLPGILHRPFQGAVFYDVRG